VEDGMGSLLEEFISDPSFSRCRPVRYPGKPGSIVGSTLHETAVDAPGASDVGKEREGTGYHGPSDAARPRALPLSERKRDLTRLCRKSKVPFLKEVQTFPNGNLLLDHCNKFEFEGVASKRLASRYLSGPSRNWVKAKCPQWKCINAERWRIFEGPRKPEPTEAQKVLAKKRQELARVLEHLRSPGLSQGIARELRKHVAILEKEIAELEST
jgi:hypothetical protein